MGFFKRFIKAITNPATIITAVAVVALGPAGFFAHSFSMATFATTVAITAAASATLQALAPTPNLPSFTDFTTEAQNRTQMIKQPTVARRVIYGEVRVSGVLGFIESTNDDKFLHMIILLAGHEVNQIGNVFVNDLQVTLDGNGNVTAPSQYANKIRILKHLGSDAQSADSTLISESNGKWTDQHRLRGVAYIYARLEFDRDAFPRGIPNISALVQGKKVFDPRTSSTGFSRNPALCVRDYLTDTKYGFGASSTEINDSTFIASANACDEDVTDSNGTTLDRYTINGTFETKGAPKQIIANMLTSCGGLVTFSNGKFRMKVAEYSTPSITLVEGDLRSAVTIQTKRSKRDNYNAVKGIFAPSENNFIATDYPAFTSSTFQTEDGGQRQFLDLDLPFTTNSNTAQRLAKIALFRNRQQVTISTTVSLKGFQLDVGDTVFVTLSRYGFTNKVFEVAEWSMAILEENGSPAFGVNLALRETNSAVYDFNPNLDERTFLQDNTTLPDPFTVAVPSLSVSDKLQTFNEEAITVLVANVTSTQPDVLNFEVQAKKSTDSTFINLGQSSANEYELLNVEDNVLFDVRARAVTRFATSSFVTAQHQVVGKSAPPADVTNFSVNIVNTEAHLSWTPTTDLDLSHYRIRHARETTGATYSNSIDLIRKVSRPANTAVVPAMTGTYFIKSVDKLGNDSVNATSSVAIIENIKELNVVQTVTESPSFAGTKTSCVVNSDNQLVLSTSTLFDSTSGNFDDQTGLFDGGGGNLATTANYDFNTVVDLTSVFTSRVTANINVVRLDLSGLLFDNILGNFDDRAGFFDGQANEFDTTNVELQIATTEGDPSSATFGSFQKFYTGDYKARGLKFRAVLTTEDQNASPAITSLSVTVDMPDRIVAENDIASTTSSSGKAITFTPAFKSLQGVGISAQNLASGDYYVITSKSATGFTITFKDSSNAVVNRTFDYVAKGFGELVA